MPSPARPEPRRTAAGGGLPVADSLFFQLVRLVNQTARPFVEGFARQHHLTLNEWRVLVVVATRGEANAAALAQAIGLDKMSVSRALAGLERRGRIVRSPDPADGRRAVVRLSAAGRSLYRTVGASGLEREARVFAALDDGERATMQRYVERLLRRLDD